MTTTEFIAKSNQIHNFKYDYSKSNYKDTRTSLVIICPSHGEFVQNSRSHLRGSGCRKCYFETVKGQPLKFNTNQFIEQSNLIHNFKYDYSKTVYNGLTNKVIIICPSHGEFEQVARSHINGFNCSKCYSDSKKLSHNDFVLRSNKIHNNKYTYNHIYNHMEDPIEIICKTHGSFFQTPHSHLSGCGCPNCNLSKGEEKIRQLFLQKNITFEEQKSFLFCMNPETKKVLKFDFYLPDFNLCIEYDGIQHFKPISYWKGEFGFQEQKLRDKIKNQYCKYNNIKLLRIPYWKINYIEDILSLRLMPYCSTPF